jgi:tetratricopeptide (TPR) repeat protein
LFISCEIGNNKDGINPSDAKDSLLFYYDFSRGDSFSLDNRRKAINKSLLFLDSNEDTLYYKVLYQKSLIHFSLKQYDSLQVFHNRFVSNTKQIKDEFTFGKQYYLMGYYFDEVAQLPDSAFNNYTFSKTYFEQTKDSIRIGRNLLNMGTIQKDQNDFFGSKETLTEALHYISKEKDSNSIAAIYNILGTNNRKLLNFDEAIKYFRLAIEKSQSFKDKLAYKNNLAATYIDYEKYSNAITILEQIKVDTTLKKTSSQYARVLDNLSYAKWLSGKKIEEKDFQAPLQLRKQNNDKRGQIASYTHLGEFYSKSNPSRAEYYFDSVVQLSKTLKIPRAEKDVLKFLMKLRPKNVTLRDRYVFLQDSLYEQELKVKTQFAKYKYDDKVTQEENVRLEKENAEKELENSKQRNQKIIYLGGFVFISTVLGLSFYGFRQRTRLLKQKSKTEKLAAINDTEAELSRKLHDDHGGKLNQVMLMVQRDADKSTILDKLEIVYNEIRNFSRQTNAVDTGPSYWESLKSTLEYAKPVEVEMVFDGGKELDWSSVGQQTKTILFKVLQELVMNMARHSKAAQTVILFKDQNNALLIYYEDDGVGASKEALLRKNGLQNTEKRIKALGGSIIFDSEEGKGFRAEIRIPKQ